MYDIRFRTVCQRSGEKNRLPPGGEAAVRDPDYSFRSLVQCGHLVALMLISLWQKGQTLVVGSAGASSGFFFRFLAAFAALMIAKRISAVRRNSTTTAAKEAERKAREQEAAERRARNDQLREEAAERARRNDSVAGRVKNTAISSATRTIVNGLIKNLGKALGGLFGGKK